MMKHSVWSLFSVILFSFLVATLLCRVVNLTVRRRSFNFISSVSELDTSNLMTEEEFELNKTLLEFAAVDLGDFEFNQDLDSITDYYNTLRSHRPYFRSIPRLMMGETPVTPRSTQLHRYWFEFKRNLQLYVRRKAYEPNVMLDLVKLVKKPIESGDVNQTQSDTSKRYSSCAVVGNSGTLLKSRYGDLIDKHEIVIRLNNAVTLGFEEYVGAKTDISFINSNIFHQCARIESCYCHRYGGNVPIVMYICQPMHLLDYTVCKPAHGASLVITDPRFDVLCARIVKYYSIKKFLEDNATRRFEDWSVSHDGPMFHYSSGMQAVMLAVGVCEKVSLFGFGKSNLTRHHYHTDQKAELSLHDYEAEYELYRDLEYNHRAIPFLPKAFKIPFVKVYH